MSRNVSDIRDDLEDRVNELGKEVRALRKMMGRRSHRAYDDMRESASDIFEDVWSQLQHSLPILRRHARGAHRTVREHPGTSTAAALIGFALIGFLVSLFFRRD